MVRNVFFMLFFITLSLGCKRELKLTKNTTKTILLESQYINFAWGYQHTVNMIDTNGIVRRYDNNNYNIELWKSVDSFGYISEIDLQYNYNLCDSLIGNLNMDTIRQCVNLISGVTTDNLSARTNEGADAGVVGYYCYIWDENKHKYKRLFLAQCGDWKQVNNNMNAQTILHLIWKNNLSLFICF